MSISLAEPIFCFTSDIDWAPEWAIAEMLDFFEQRQIPLCPFITHDSAEIRRRYADHEKKQLVGIHPNFLPGSTQGNSPDEIADYLLTLWPEAKAYRSHAFVDSTPIADLFAKRGLLFDSNLCLFLQPRCEPLKHNSGLMRFPVFWEDDVHFKRGLPCELSSIREHFDSPGLKVINLHPFLFAMNVPDVKYYQKVKHLIRETDPQVARAGAFEGKGTRSIVTEILDYVLNRGYRIMSLPALYHAAANIPASQNGNKSDSVLIVEGTAAALKLYQSASTKEKAELLRDIYDHRDVEETYATSRDHNLRELEIAFIRERLSPGDILDIGCGNGYTLLSLAKEIKGNFVGLDFSAEMIRGAGVLAEQMKDELKSKPDFCQADVRHLPFDSNSFDYVISERCLQNLPSREDQWATLAEIHRVLRPGGSYLMVEGTEDGLDRLNELRARLSLDPIPSVSPDNVSSLKFREAELESHLEPLFQIVHRQYWGTYYLISRILHPLLVAPDKPRFDSRINTVARKIAAVLPDIDRLGHVMGYELRAKK